VKPDNARNKQIHGDRRIKLAETNRKIKQRKKRDKVEVEETGTG
jgi:hypothetical protein